MFTCDYAKYTLSGAHNNTDTHVRRKHSQRFSRYFGCDSSQTLALAGRQPQNTYAHAQVLSYPYDPQEWDQVTKHIRLFDPMRQSVSQVLDQELLGLLISLTLIRHEPKKGREFTHAHSPLSPFQRKNGGLSGSIFPYECIARQIRMINERVRK